MWFRLVVVCDFVYVVRSRMGLQYVVVCRFLCWYLVGSGGSTGYVHFCVALLCCVSLCACIGLRVSWCPALCVALGLVWCWALSRCVMLRGGASCDVPLWHVAVVFFCCCCFRWGLLGSRSAAFFWWQFLWSFSLLCVVVWLIIGVLCWYVSCASLLCLVAPCYVWLSSIVRSYGSCFVSWRVLCCGVLCCCVVLRCVGLYIGVRRRALSHSVVCCYLAVCSLM